MTTLLIAAYAACAVATHGWIVAADVRKADLWELFLIAVLALCWPITAPMGIWGRRKYKMPLWQGWRLR